jgi:hypothetical protein
MVGFTTASAVLMPLLGFVLAIACCVSYVPNIKSYFRRGLVYLCSMIYPVIYAASIFLLSLDQLGSDKAINEGWPMDFMGHAKFVFDGPVVLSFLVVGTILGVVLVGKRDRRFLVAWIVSAVVCYLNPIISPIIIEHVTSPNIYWRVFSTGDWFVRCGGGVTAGNQTPDMAAACLCGGDNFAAGGSLAIVFVVGVPLW